ncbi:nitrous oxidase accessory protein [Rhizobium petrolearium]|uniref:nitrous oxide reductase family maturation protein NosD n=1 Tax=Neorhizobium petrolearium TaxID=515361 RepID=UPI001F3DB33C|nr:nitrous oxide reductase family maturation protein NosD [Neorhizobium petrolearium]MBP1842858.1 nitrous oxidase accessory protein [Neorhizobium petrolearium]
MAAFWAALPAVALAEDRIVSPAEGRSLQAVIDAAAAGDVITLKAGEYAAPIAIGKPLILSGEKGARIVGNGRGSVITINAAGVTIRNLAISGSGYDLTALDSGVLATEAATGAVIEGNVMTGNLFGIYLHGAANSVAQRNTIVGLQGERLSEAGNGVSVWNAPGAQVLDNVIGYGRDGIATMASKRNVFSRNRFSDLRFGIHYMYTNDSEISDNISTGNSVGYAIMFSNRLKITGNVSDGDRDHGLLLNYANSSIITGNSVFGRLQPASRWLLGGNRNADPDMPKSEDTTSIERNPAGLRPGPEKCVFIYNANKNRFADNRFEGCAIGIHFTAGSEANAISGNAFINNRNQVKYVGTRYMDWSKDGRGNYWSDNPAFDLNGDGIADNPYRPNDLIDKVLWTAPQAKLLTTSPAVQVIRWAQAQFPALLPGGVVDSHPLMRPITGKRQQIQ